MAVPPLESVLELLADWLPTQRWFPFKNDTVALFGRLEIGGFLDLSTTQTPQYARVWGMLVRVTDSLGSQTLLQVPLTIYRAEALADSAPAHVPATSIIGSVLFEGQTYILVDAPFDGIFLHSWVTGLQQSMARPIAPGERCEQTTADNGVTVFWEHDQGLPTDWIMSTAEDLIKDSHVISSEQSNTSMVIRSDPPVILKLFRVLSAGINPDVLVPRALAAAGWTQVPRPFGWTVLSWPELSQPAANSDPISKAVGHGSVLSEFIPEAEDGFELACAMVVADLDFTDLAAQLGTMTAQLHDRLAAAFGLTPAPHPSELATTLTQRAEWAMDAVPELREFAAHIAAIHQRVASLPILPAAQRLHGDYHLGQVMWSHHVTAGETRGWVVLDFEGEPLRPLAERALPDLALRDVAGMIRSIDYAFAVGQGTHSDWVARARSSFLSGYLTGKMALKSASMPSDDSHNDLLLRAYELDKALYESVYEAQNRPKWLAVPRAALHRILA